MLRLANASGCISMMLTLGACAVEPDAGASALYDPGYRQPWAGSHWAEPTSNASIDGNVESNTVAESSYVSPRTGTIVTREPGETTIIRPGGGITVIQRDADGTRTVVGSDGVRVVAPGWSRRHR